jgi:hypothetical protein
LHTPCFIAQPPPPPPSKIKTVVLIHAFLRRKFLEAIAVALGDRGVARQLVCREMLTPELNVLILSRRMNGEAAHF